MTDVPAGLSVLVAGYASVDYAMAVAPFRGVNATTLVHERADEWPRVGGIAHVTSAAARATSAAVGALSWVGPDDAGRFWRSAVEASGVGTAAVAVTGTRTPNSHLIYPEDGGTICLFDAADCHAALSEVQAEAVRAADWVVLTVGPTAPTRAVLDELRDDSKLVWIVKDDEAAVPVDLRRDILRRADVVTMSEGESGFAAATGELMGAGALVVETMGSKGARLSRVLDGRLHTEGTVPAIPVLGVDTTGAGDTFAGTFVGLLAEDDSTLADPAVAIAHLNHAAAATADLLRTRLSR